MRHFYLEKNYILRLKSISIYIFFILNLVFVNIIYAQIPEVPQKPKFETSVYDEANLLSAEQKLALEQKLIQYADSTSTQIVIATILTTGGEEIGYYATHWAHKWGIGQADKDNGILILVAKDDRKMTIRTGYGMEHMLTDALSRRIIEKVMIPHFKQDDYYGGLNEATNVMFKIFAGEYENNYEKEKSSFPFFAVIIIVVFIIIIIAISSKNSGGNGGKSVFSDDIFGPIILSRMGRGGFGGGNSGGFGSGGFGGGFGGGGFGGGGASGGW